MESTQFIYLVILSYYLWFKFHLFPLKKSLPGHLVTDVTTEKVITSNK